MTFSRMHVGLMGIVSIFTGIISPVVQNNMASFPFPLTDLQIPAYLLLILLAVLCIFLAVRSRGWVRFFGLVLLLLIGYLFIIVWNGEVKSLTGIIAPSISWGWIFLFIGSGLLIWSMFGDENIVDEPSLGDHLIGWLSALTILALTGLIVSISYIPRIERPNKINILSNIFGSGVTETHSGLIESKAFPSINKLMFDRKRDNLSFFTSSGTQMISVPSGKIYNRLPYATTRIGDTNYIISAEGIVTTETGIVIGKAVLPQQIEQTILMQSGATLMKLDDQGIQSYSGEYAHIGNVITTKEGEHILWKSKFGSGYAIYEDGKIKSEEQYEISNISASSNGKSIMAMVREADGSGYILKNGSKIEKIGKGYIEGTLRMNGSDSIYAVERDGAIELIYNGVLMDRKFDEIREIFIEKESDGFVYFGRPLGEKTYCLYTRYRGNLCGLSGYMNPRLSPDGASVIYAALKDGVWGIYRNASPIIRNTGYPNRDNISQDYVFFDITNPSYYLFIRYMDNGYQLYTKGGWVPGIWKDVGLDATFGYDNKIIMSAQDNVGWKVIEF